MIDIYFGITRLKITRSRLINKRNDSFQFLSVELVREFLLVLMIYRVGTRYEVAATEPEEQQSRKRPCEDRKTKPFGDLPQIVGTRYKPVHAFFRKVMISVSGFAQMTDYVIGMHVNNPSCKEDYRSDDETRIGEPC